MVGIILRFSLGVALYPLCSYGADDIDKLTRNFAEKTRMGSHNSIPTSVSLYSLREVDEKSRQSPSLHASASPLSSSGESDSNDDYTGQTEAIFRNMEKGKKASRKFNKKSLVEFLLERQRIDLCELDCAPSHLDTLEIVINSKLELFEKDLVSGIRDNTLESIMDLTDIQKVTNRHEEYIREINMASDNISHKYLNDSFSYYSTNLSNLFYKHCQPNKKDLQEIWQTKALIFTTNLHIHLTRFNNLFLTEISNSPLRQELQKNLGSPLISFFNESCTYFKYWYEHNRSIFTQSLKWIGMRDSGTREKFNQFTNNYFLLFGFLYDAPLPQTQLTAAKDETLTYFNGVDNNFSESISTLGRTLSWRNPPTQGSLEKNSLLAQKEPVAQPAKPPASWEGWW